MPLCSKIFYNALIFKTIKLKTEWFYRKLLLKVSGNILAKDDDLKI